MTKKTYLISASAAILLTSAYIVNSSTTIEDSSELAQVSEKNVIETTYSATSKPTTKKISSPTRQNSIASEVHVVNDRFVHKDIHIADVPASNLFVENLYIPPHRKKDDKLSFVVSKKGQKGTSYYKYQQKYKGLRVYGAQIIAQVSPSRELETVTGQFSSNIELDTTASLDGDTLLTQTLENISDGDTSHQKIYEEPKLMVYVDRDDTPYLAYESVAKYTDTNGVLQIQQLFMDANSGDLINSVTRLHSARDIAIYEQTRCMGNGGTLPGTQKRTGDTATGNQKVDDAFEYLDDAYWFYQKMFNRDSYDMNGARITASVNLTFRSENSYTCSGLNAFFSSDDKQLLFGAGDNSVNAFTAAADVVAHELTHGVTWKESNLAYQDESGALNEALSDIFAATTQAWVASGGSENNNPSTIEIKSDTWTVGEALGSEGWMRYMNNPTQDGKSYDNYTDRYTGSNDNGGVHTNSGIANLSYVLLASGGTHPKNKTNVDVPGIGMTKAISIWYEAQTNQLAEQTDFSQLRSKLASAATALYGDCSAEYQATQLSLDAVKIPGTWECETAETTPPTIFSVSPSNNASSIELSQAINVYMSEAIDASSVTTSSVTLRTANGSSVAANVSLNSTNRITIIPTSDLAYETTYTITISTAVKDIVGNALANTYSSNFTTKNAPVADTEAPSIIALSLQDHTDAVPVSSQYTLEFDEALSSSSITTNSVLVTDASGSQIPLSVSYSNNKIIVSPSQSLEYSTDYKLHLTKAITDVAGNNLDYSISVYYTTVDSSQKDTTAPAMLYSEPQDNGVNVDVTKAITLNFDESLLSGSVDAQSISLKDELGNVVNATIGYEDKVITITPSKDLDFATTYVVQVNTALSDLFDNTLSSILDISFTTASSQVDSTNTPTITNVVPTANEVVATNTTPSVSFSIEMDESTLLSAVTLSANGNSVSGSVSLSNNVATFTPDITLSSDTTYTLAVSTDALSSDGVALSSAFTSSFKTETQDDTPTSTDPLADATLVASSEYSTSNSIENIRDGMGNTAWFSQTNNAGPQQEETVQLDLKSETFIKDIVIDWDDFYFAREMQISVYTNGSWNVLANISKNESSDTTQAINQNITGILIRMRGGFYGGWYSITELTLH